ncbi:MAG: hypothetical protein HRT77_09440 [Halioglobus sp.]|nr:hypothetical protein [Halioglobus sp.]
MTKAIAHGYPRTLAVALAIGLGLWFATSEARIDTWASLLPLFEWMETTPLGVIGQSWGAVFATVQAVHLLGMALLGGAVLVADGRLLDLAFRDTPLLEVQTHCHRLFTCGLVTAALTGLFMTCGVAIKIYYLPVFWYKMLALAVGVAFVYGVRRPLLRQDSDQVHPAVLKLLAVASLMVWFTVAATGRWIGFSG